MVEVMPINFPIPTENAIASYDWFDIASGFGYKKLYCIGGRNSGGNTYFLTTNLLYSDSENQGVSNGASNNVYTFDLDINRTLIIGGAKVYVHLETVSTGPTGSFIAKIYHVTSGGTETLLGSETSDDWTFSNNIKTFTIDMTKKNFKKTDKLRYKIDFTSGGNSAGFNFNISTAELSITIPLKVDL